MTLSNVKPSYPSSVLSWLDRVDNQDVDFANDINSVVADLESVETVVGTNPQIESAPPTGNPINYASVSTRISDAMSNAQLPFVSLTLPSQTLSNTSSGMLLSFKSAIDGYGSYNGNDITVPASGWWIVSSVMQWSWWNEGYVHHSMTLNGSSNVLGEKLVDWAFSGNVQPVLYKPGAVINGVPQVFVGNPIVTPPWWSRGKRPLRTSVDWQGALHKGDRISVYAENGTSNAATNITNASLKASMLRVIPGTFTSG